VGELSRPKDAAFPIIAAIGGMAMPAALYTLFNFGAPTGVGWAIPMATDIAFSLSVLALLGEQIPIGLKVFLSTLAIADDLGSIAIIAVFFTTSIALLPLLVAGGILVLLVLVGRTAIRNPSIYMVLGVGVWLCFLLSGVHATIAGVLVAMTVPARPILDTGAFCSKGEQLLREFESATKPGCDILANKEQYAAAQAMESICERVMTPLQRLESYVQPWVIFGIIPLFALANAGVLLVLNPFVTFANMTFLGVVLGLVLGKPIGISLFAWLGVRLGLAAKPKGVTWRQISAASCLGGIGFTMSLFLANLALGSTPHLDVAKVAILAGSLIAGTLGFVLLGGSRMILGLLRKIRLRVSRILNRNSTVKQS
jgi:NhaA family Na+:H+ antiporter